MKIFLLSYSKIHCSSLHFERIFYPCMVFVNIPHGSLENISSVSYAVDLSNVDTFCQQLKSPTTSYHYYKIVLTFFFNCFDFMEP